MFAVMLVSVISVVLFAGGAVLFSRIFPHEIELLLDYLFLLAVAFGLVLLLNIYICPYKVKIRNLLPGTSLTIFAWALALIGFALYLKFGNAGRLYGALSTLIVFLLWLYVLMICFVSGVIFNSRKVTAQEPKRL